MVFDRSKTSGLKMEFTWNLTVPRTLFWSRNYTWDLAVPRPLLWWWIYLVFDCSKTSALKVNLPGTWLFQEPCSDHEIIPGIWLYQGLCSDYEFTWNLTVPRPLLWSRIYTWNLIFPRPLLETRIYTWDLTVPRPLLESRIYTWDLTVPGPLLWWWMAEICRKKIKLRWGSFQNFSQRGREKSKSE